MNTDMPQVAAGVAPARDLGWDVLRVLACIMVIVVHARGPYTYHTDGTLDFWAAFYFVLVRAGVPLFVMLSSALLLPLRQTTGDFLKRRFMRVALPFVIWSVIFAFLPLPGDLRGYAPQYDGITPAPGSYWAEVLYGLLSIPFTFTGKTCPYWFLFIIFGLYLLMPMISPWIRQVSKRQLAFFVGLWGLTLLYPLLGYLNLTELHGVCAWNRISTGYYLTGYIGYLLLAVLLMRLDTCISARKAVGIGVTLFIVGFIPTFILALWLAPMKADAMTLERVIDFFSPAVVLMTAGCFMALRHIRPTGWCGALITRLSKRSFVIFLAHWAFAVWGWPIAAEWHLPAIIGMPLLTLAIFLLSWALAEFIACLPRPLARALGDA